MLRGRVSSLKGVVEVLRVVESGSQRSVHLILLKKTCLVRETD